MIIDKRINYLKSAFIRLTCLVLLLIIFPLCSNGQSGFSCVKLKQVNFTGNIDIVQDNGTTYPTTAHWLDNNDDGNANTVGEHKFPVCYKSGEKIKVEGKFKIDPAQTIPSGYKIKIKGECKSASFNTKLKEQPVTPTSTEIVYPATETDDIIPANKVDFLNPMTITWSISWDDGGSWNELGKTENRVYVTKNAPSTGAIMFESVLDIACRYTGGLSDDLVIANKIFSEFETRIPGVIRKQIDGFNNPDNKNMIYWLNDTPNMSLLGLLSDPNGNGNCYTWAALFSESLKAIGIGGSQIAGVKHKSFPNIWLMVNKWKYDKHIISGSNGICNSAKTGDDYEIIPKDQGKPRENCIIPNTGATKIKTKIKGGDDEFVISGLDTIAINTGSNGICETKAKTGDIQIIIKKNGLKNTTCTTPGANGVLNSTCTPDDKLKNGLNSDIDPVYRYFLYSERWGTNIIYLGGDIAPQSGVNGQGNSNPPQLFQNHFVVIYNNSIYDPSYGIKVTGGTLDVNKKNYENTAFAGFFKEMASGFIEARLNDPAVLEIDIL